MQAPNTETLLAAASGPRLEAALGELRDTIEHRIPTWRDRAPPRSRTAFLRDVRALLAECPDSSAEGLPEELRNHRGFSVELRQALAHAEQLLLLRPGCPLNSIHGPWEGGLPAAECPRSATQEVKPLVVAALNVGGALGRDRKLVGVTVQAAQQGATVVVVSEPRLPPGMPWPQCGFTFLGERTASPGSVAVLVAEEHIQSITQLADVGDARALWLQAPATTEAVAGVLVLAVYGPPPGHGVTVRRQFWEARMREWRSLSSRAQYRGWGLVIAGDFNLHFAGLV